MKIYLRFTFLLFMCFAAVNVMALSGKWRGNLKLGPTKLPVVLSFIEDPAGNTTATMDSPRQNAKDIPLEVMYLSTDSLSVESKSLGATFAARINGDKIKGSFVQNGLRLPLTLMPEKPLSELRPQTPVPPYPYTQTRHFFASADGTLLAGTLVVPELVHGGKCPVVVMVTGSGPQNRDEEIFEHRPFVVIADYLARNGVASFRYDDRGVGESKGDHASATIHTFKEDASSALRFVQAMPEFGKAGILGHSEGGTLAFLIAAEGSPDFIVTLAGMATPSRETMLQQNIRALDQSGITGRDKEDSIRLIELLYDNIIAQYAAGQFSPIDVDALCIANSLEVPSAVLESVKRNSAARNGYFDSLVSLDPTDALRKIECPVLAINGTKDVQVEADANLGAIAGYVPHAETRRMEGLNHLMQHAATGDVGEYHNISETISPEVLDIIADFVGRQ